MSERTFSEDEIAALMRRAADLQMGQSSRAIPGLTLSELEEIAAESGIPPEFLRAAVRESDSGVTTRNLSGQTDTHAYLERVVPGVLSGDEWADIVIRLRKKYGRDSDMGGGPMYGQGVTEQLGNQRSWRHSSTLGVITEFTIRTIDGAQHIHFQRRVGMSSPRVEGIGYGSVLAILAGSLGGGISESVWLLMLVFVAVLAIAAPTIEYLDRKWRSKILREMKVVTDEIAHGIHDPAEAEQVQMAEGTKPSILDGIDAEKDAAATATGNRLRS